MKEFSASVEIINELGLHARAAANFVKVASKYKADVSVAKDKLSANGKSIMGVMMLAAPRGSIITITTKGADAEDALNGLMELIQNKFGESR